MPALWAGLRGEPWVDGNHCATTPALFVFQHPAKRPPALIQDRCIQTGFGSDMAPWFLDSATCRPRHIVDLQVFEHDNRVVFAGLCRKLVQEVVTTIGN